jgi:fluoroacetyl-CoA thioesterase
MNEQGTSEISFEEVCTVDPEQTARRLFAKLAHGNAYAHHLLEGLATGYLIALIESVCIREMLRHLDPVAEVIVGSAVNIQHRAPVPPGNQVWLRGWTSQLCERKATFTVQAFDDHEVICEGTLTLVAASRQTIEGRLARKLRTDNARSGDGNATIIVAAAALPPGADGDQSLL